MDDISSTPGSTRRQLVRTSGTPVDIPLQYNENFVHSKLLSIFTAARRRDGISQHGVTPGTKLQNVRLS